MSTSFVVSSADSHVRAFFKAFFKAKDYKVTIENHGSRALLKVLENPVDLFIHDVPMKNELNLDIIEIIRKVKPRVPIIVLCENTSIKIVRTFAEVGVFYCAMKPIQLGEIEKVIEAIERLHENKAMRSAGTIR